MSSNEPVRELTRCERFTWGECPVCHAPHGEECNPDVGISLGVTVSGLPARDGAHLARLRTAPMKVRMVPA